MALCFTVIITNFNDAPTLEQAICSALDQNGRTEVILVDGGSTDGSREIARLSEDARLQTVRADLLHRVEAAQRGVDRATGDVVTVLGSRSVLMPGAIEEVEARMLAADRPEWLVGQGLWVSPEGELRGPATACPPRSFDAMLRHDSGSLPLEGAFFRRELLDRFGRFDADLPHVFDFEYACRLIHGGVNPTILHRAVVARRLRARGRSIGDVLSEGEQRIRVACRYARDLPWLGRMAMWGNLDIRRRVYALAASEAPDLASSGQIAVRLGAQVLTHPWWLAHRQVRDHLLHAHRMSSPDPSDGSRPGARAA